MPRLLPAAWLLLVAPLTPAAEPRVAFPPDASVLDAKRDLGAKGDGVADDTAALQKGIELSSGFNQRTTKILYLPAGTYRVTKPLVVENALGPWLYGESRDAVVIKLADGSKGATCVLRTHPRETNPSSADWFMRNVRNVTFDAGDNPQADGVRWHATNSGILQNCRVVGNGKVGVFSGFVEQGGPNLVQDVTVDGFETGVRAQWMWGQTLSRVTVKNARAVGLEVNATAVAAEDLVVENCPAPVVVDRPNDWHWWGGVLAVVNGKLTGADPAGPAARVKGVLYARNLATRGFKSAVETEAAAGRAAGPDVAEYKSHGELSVFPPEKWEPLPVRRAPVLAWETDPAKWVCANDFGAVAGDDRDDTAAIQKAIDAAAAAGQTVVTLRGCGGGDPNHYTLDGEVTVRGPVRLVIGLGFGRVIAGKAGRFVVTDASAPDVHFRHLDSFGGPPVTLENRSAKNALVAESCGVTVTATGGGPVFLTDCPAHLHLKHPNAQAWCRHLNPEGDSDTGLVTNAGGSAWILGLKCEGRGVRVRTTAGGRTEVYGAFLYGPGIAKDDKRPLFATENSTIGVFGLRELAFGGDCHHLKMTETRGQETRAIGDDAAPGWQSWAAYRGTPGR